MSGGIKEKTIKTAVILAVILLFHLFTISLYWITEYKVLDDDSYWLLIPDFLILFSLSFFALRPLYKRYVKGKGEYSAIGYSLILCFQIYLLTETATSALPFKITALYCLMSYFIVAFPVLLLLVIFGRPFIAFIIAEVVYAVFTLVQYYIIAFRGGPIMFSDIDNIQSAVDIKSSYKLFISCTVVMIVLQLAMLIFITIKNRNKRVSGKNRLKLLGALVAGVIAFLGVSDYSFTLGNRMRYLAFGFSGFEDAQSFRNAGDVLTLYYSARYGRLVTPKDYSAEYASGLLAEYASSEQTALPEKKPTIIAIMNESFSDFSHIEEFETSKDYIPYWRGLSENVIKGYVTVSAYGGYSCNSEWEFLSGNSMYFMPSGYAAYTNCMKGRQDSLVSTLNSYGYETTSIAMCSRYLWDIEKAYNYLGFKNQYYTDNADFDEPEYINGNITDWTAYRKIISLYENRDRSKGNFFWLTTMQNHANYDVDVDRGIELAGRSDTSVTRYLNTIKESDLALEKLIAYFEKEEEPVVIVFFGDHYPHLPSFAESLYGQKLGGMSVKDYSRIHQTPFVIWSNMDVKEQQYDSISLNYLSLEVMEAAGLPLNSFQRFLSEIRKDLPIISGFGYMDSNGEWYSRDDEKKYETIIEKYRVLEYYNIFGSTIK